MGNTRRVRKRTAARGPGSHEVARDPAESLDHFLHQYHPPVPVVRLGNTAKSASPDLGETREEILQNLVLERNRIDETMRSIVDSLRADGSTWREIGTLLGISHEAARGRFS